jgi:CheY-like chemotaxis protein
VNLPEQVGNLSTARGKLCYTFAQTNQLTNQPTNQPTNQLANAPRPMNILVVDDSEAIRAIITDLLKQAYPDPDIMLATNGLEGVTLAESGQPDVILLDWSMPYMDGLTAAQQLRQSAETKHIPLIGMTTEYDLPEVNTQLAQLCTAVIRKPFNGNELIQLLNRVQQPQPASPAPNP